MKMLWIVSVLVMVAGLVIVGWRGSMPATSPEITPSVVDAIEVHAEFLYGRVTLDDGSVYVGRLRWGGDEEAFWGDYFNGSKDENPWAVHVSPEHLTERHPVAIFGVELAQREHQLDLDRPFMGRFGDIARIEADGRELRVTLKSGTTFDLDRFSADDFADVLRVWDGARGAVDFDESRVWKIEFLSAAKREGVLGRLHGTVRTRNGDFTGFIQWNRKECLGTDELNGESSEGEVSLHFRTIRAIERLSSDSSLVTLTDGREFELSGTREVGAGHRGVYVDDRRYGRVLVSWDAFVRLDFNPGGDGLAYDDFPPGRPLAGEVMTRSGSRFRGRLVYDLDEGETTETLDAPSRGVNYSVPFDLIASIQPLDTQGARVALHSGEELQLEAVGDLGEGNAGMLIFTTGDERPTYVPWDDVERVAFDRLPAKLP